MDVTISNVTTEERAFLRAAADLVNPGMTDQQVVDWLQDRARTLVVLDVRDRIIAGLREDYNTQTRDWETQFSAAFPQEED